MPILVSGSLVYDHIMNFPDSFKNHIMTDKIHILNVSFVVNTLQKSWGGTAGNIAYTLKLLGSNPEIISALGSDAREYLEHFTKNDISATSIVVDNTQPSASAYITTDADDNQITAFYPGPLARASEIVLSKLANAGDIMIVSPTDKRVMMRHVIDGKALGMRVVFDPGQQVIGFTDIELKQMIERSEWVIGNDYEMSIIEDRTGYTASDMLETCQAVITTLGDKGSRIVTKDSLLEVPICPATSVDDPTGAGDAYRAGFFVGIALGYSMKTCAQMGSVAASYAIETYGTQAHRFTKEEFGKRYQETFQEKISL